MTRWPMRAIFSLTPAPTAATIPHGSCPPITGFGLTGKPPIAAAHARGLHFDDDLAGPRGRVGKLHHLDLLFPREDNTAHRFLRFSRNNMKAAYALSRLPSTTLTPESCQ